MKVDQWRTIILHNWPKIAFSGHLPSNLPALEAAGFKMVHLTITKLRLMSKGIRDMMIAVVCFALLAHRGPDGEGIHVEPGVGLAHRRLGIIDLETGQQPLCNQDGSVWITFNGEVFNYVELRAELIKCGHVFRTHSDTETLVRAYEQYGLDFVEKLNGQFAFALWDRRCRGLVLGRDRVGIRPLFISTLPDGTLLFAFECKALFARGDIAVRIDPAAVAQIAALWVPVPPRTAFMDVEELAPGTLLVIENGALKLHRYCREFGDRSPLLPQVLHETGGVSRP